jgi:hypothetical protein
MSDEPHERGDRLSWFLFGVIAALIIVYALIVITNGGYSK